ncbi:envelope glycoprotein J [Saimiriine alphaherpesvirus 1]|uniref:Envelope glycoprotein J n=1 Tax=Saimiriine herpesvirus 1 (strain MV-5-4-PSL) TaxID=10353 RepID=E2IUH7_SHV1|nr:envelope glycoprotein J [Saimiriine alphaherpesvirus 1]ADO13835.1 envelope glycoprotein J [Saimiriine alphaherpesvirus 1]
MERARVVVAWGLVVYVLLSVVSRSVASGGSVLMICDSAPTDKADAPLDLANSTTDTLYVDRGACFSAVSWLEVAVSRGARSQKASARPVCRRLPREECASDATETPGAYPRVVRVEPGEALVLIADSARVRVVYTTRVRCDRPGSLEFVSTRGDPSDPPRVELPTPAHAPTKTHAASAVVVGGLCLATVFLLSGLSAFSAARRRRARTLNRRSSEGAIWTL